LQNLPFPSWRSRHTTLTVPSAATIVHGTCSASLGPDQSAVIGQVKDPESLQPVVGAEISVEWIDPTAGSAKDSALADRRGPRRRQGLGSHRTATPGGGWFDVVTLLRGPPHWRWAMLPGTVLRQFHYMAAANGPAVGVAAWCHRCRRWLARAFAARSRQCAGDGLSWRLTRHRATSVSARSPDADCSRSGWQCVVPAYRERGPRRRQVPGGPRERRPSPGAVLLLYADGWRPGGPGQAGGREPLADAAASVFAVVPTGCRCRRPDVLGRSGAAILRGTDDLTVLAAHRLAKRISGWSMQFPASRRRRESCVRGSGMAAGTGRRAA
jgi:hypothetical protein